MSELNLPGLTTLRRIELETLYRVGEILSRSLDFRHTSREILRALDEQAGMSRSMVSVLDPESGDLVVHAVSGSEEEGQPYGDIGRSQLYADERISVGPEGPSDGRPDIVQFRLQPPA